MVFESHPSIRFSYQALYETLSSPLSELAHPYRISSHYDIVMLLQVHIPIKDSICFLQTFLVAIASAGAIRVDNSEKMEEFDNAKSDTVAEATGFDGFGGFGGFRGFHQFNGFMSNAFGDLEGQFDTTGFNKDFSASQNRKFDTGLLYFFMTRIYINRSNLGL